MKPLIDADILQYECGFAAEASWKHMLKETGREGEDSVPPFDLVAELLENRIAAICRAVEATEEPAFYFTGKENFRIGIAKTAPYKSRPGNKPWHYKNIKAYLQATKTCYEEDGLEADDLLAIALSRQPETTICCSRDKDLKAVPGWHYSWELGNQPAFGPERVEGWGYLTLSTDRKKIQGVGEKFFWCQMLTGDRVDTIPGVPGMGAVGAFKLLEHTNTPAEAFKAVSGAYKASYGLYWNEVMLEQGQLLHMVRSISSDGFPVMWELPNEE